MAGGDGLIVWMRTRPAVVRVIAPWIATTTFAFAVLVPFLFVAVPRIWPEYEADLDILVVPLFVLAASGIAPALARFVREDWSEIEDGTSPVECVAVLAVSWIVSVTIAVLIHLHALPEGIVEASWNPIYRGLGFVLVAAFVVLFTFLFTALLFMFVLLALSILWAPIAMVYRPVMEREDADGLAARTARRDAEIDAARIRRYRPPVDPPA